VLFAAEPCSLRVGKAGVAPVPGHAHEFRFSLSFLTGRIEEAGFRVDAVAGKRTALRFAHPVLRSPSLDAFRPAGNAGGAPTMVRPIASGAPRPLRPGRANRAESWDRRATAAVKVFQSERKFRRGASSRQDITTHR
jgi:hypothetical protein